MARPLRIEYPGAIYHVMARGNARQAIFTDDADRQKLLKNLEDTVLRCGWELFSFVFMPNHIHLFLCTPRPNLSGGMQRLLSTYASGYARRHGRQGHLFQGRFKAELVEDESYFWTVSRYIHLNPVRGKHPGVSHPRDWAWSSYGGYADGGRRLSWVAYDGLLEAWEGGWGGTDAAAAYRRYVEQGLETPPENPFSRAVHGWLLGGEGFVDRIGKLMKSPRYGDEVPRARLLGSVKVERVWEAVIGHYRIDPEVLSTRGEGHMGRAVAAWLARRLTSVTLRELSDRLGLGRPESVSNLTRRVEGEMAKNEKLRQEIATIESQILHKTKNKV